jgi:hypothetical protein
VDSSASPEFTKLNVGPSPAPTQNKVNHHQAKDAKISSNFKKTSSPKQILSRNHKGVLARGRTRSPSPARVMMPQESPKSPIFPEESILKKIGEMQVSFLLFLPSYDACTWEASVSHEARKTWKDNRWKQILKNPYIRVYALDYFESSKPRWTVSWDAPNYQCCLWEPSQELAPERKTWKDNRWKQILKNPYVRVYALAYYESGLPLYEEALPSYKAMLWDANTSHAERKTWKDNRWKQILKNSYICRAYALDYFESSKPRWTVFWNPPNYECCSWEPSQELAPERKTWKDNRWKQILKNPYVRVYALAYYESSLPLWETPVASYEACTWEANLSHEVCKTWKDNSWKQILKNPYVRVFALDYYESSKPRWTTTKTTLPARVVPGQSIKLDRPSRRSESFEQEFKTVE